MFTILKTILKSIFAAIGLCCKIVYRILKGLRIRLLALYLVVCGFLQLAFHVFKGQAYIFWIGVAVCGCFTLLAWAVYFRGKFVRSKVKREPPHAAEETLPKEEQTPARDEKREKEWVRYYDVSGRPDYVFAEYGDRYELYYRSGNELTLVRTDYKNEN